METLFERWARMKIDTPPQQERPLKRNTPLGQARILKRPTLRGTTFNFYLINYSKCKCLTNAVTLRRLIKILIKSGVSSPAARGNLNPQQRSR
jgi:hypothetical protein